MSWTEDVGEMEWQGRGVSYIEGDEDGLGATMTMWRGLLGGRVRCVGRRRWRGRFGGGRRRRVRSRSLLLGIGVCGARVSCREFYLCVKTFKLPTFCGYACKFLYYRPLG